MRDLVRPDLPIRTGRLLLRPLTEDDVPALLAYRSLPEVCRFLPFEPMDEAEVRRRLAEQWSTLELRPGGSVTLGIEHDGTLVGDVVLFGGDRATQTAEIGWVLSPDQRGHGYATEAAAALLPVVFDGLEAHRVIARMDPANDASAAVAARIGMRREALHVEDAFIKGEWVDTLLSAMLEREFRALEREQTQT